MSKKGTITMKNGNQWAKFIANSQYGVMAASRQTGQSTAMTQAMMQKLGIQLNTTFECKECTTFYYRDVEGWKTYCNDCHTHHEAPYLIALVLEMRKRKGGAKALSWDGSITADSVVVMKDEYWMWEEIDEEQFSQWKP